MKKKILATLIILSCLLLSGCIDSDSPVVKDEELEVQDETQNQILLNSISCFVYTFQDPDTGVWYMCTSEGITPRLNPDGSLYLSK
mgnify:CR=1 FL=1